MPEILLYFLSSSISLVSPLRLSLCDYSNKMSDTTNYVFLETAIECVTTFKSSNILGFVTNMSREFACRPFASVYSLILDQFCWSRFTYNFNLATKK